MLCALNPEDLVPQDHPLRKVKALADEALKRLDAQLDAMYAEHGRPSVPPEQLLKSMLLMALYSIRSDRMFHEQLQYNLLFRWFLDMDMDERVFDRTVFSHNRERLLEHDVARALFGAVVEQARERKLMSSEHFSVDGTLVEPGRRRRAFVPRTTMTTTTTAGATSEARSARTRRTSPRPTRSRSCTARAMATRRSSATWLTR